MFSSCFLKYPYSRYKYSIHKPEIESFLNSQIRDSVLGYCYFYKDSNAFNNNALLISKHSVTRIKLKYKNKKYQIKAFKTYVFSFSDRNMYIPHDSLLTTSLSHSGPDLTITVNFNQKYYRRTLKTYYLRPRVYVKNIDVYARLYELAEK